MSRWLEETGGTSGASYAQRFAELAAAGVDVHGEAAYLDALLEPGATVLDAGCGTGRVGSELARRGYRVHGVDSDPSMLEQAQADPAVTWTLADLAELALDQRFDLVVAAGNVVVFLAPGTEQQVVARLAAHLVPGGLLVSGWRTDRLAVPAYDAWALAAGLEPVVRHATWQGDPWYDGADWCVAVDRLPAAGA
ncbi:MAG: class I SAM-dependent DNA methyltransferase [Mycobacteriales bacterium]